MDLYKEEADRLGDWASFLTIKFYGDIPPRSGQTAVLTSLLHGHLINQTYFLAMLRVLAERHGVKREDVERAFAEEAAKLCSKLQSENPGFQDTGGRGIRKVDHEAANRTMAGWR